MKKKLWIATLSLVLSLCVGLTMVGCGGTPQGERVEPEFTSREQIYGFSAMTAAQLAAGTFTGGARAMSADGFGLRMAIAAEEAEEPVAPDSIDIDELNKYMSMIDGILAKNPVETVVEESDRTEYAHKMTVSTTAVDGSKSGYVMYYNETVLEEEQDDDDDKEDETELEVETELDGIMIIDEVEYVLSGKRESETEDGETEVETKMTAKLDDNNYVRIQEEIETGETEYVYEVYKDGKLVEKTAMEYEQDEDGELELKLSFLNGDNKGFYKFKKEFNGNHKSTVKLSYDADGKEGSAKIEVFTNPSSGEVTYKYIFKNGETIERGKIK